MSEINKQVLYPGLNIVPGRPLSVGLQGEAVMLWFATGLKHSVYIALTGEHLPPGKFIGSVIGVEGRYVVHVFDQTQEDQNAE